MRVAVAGSGTLVGAQVCSALRWAQHDVVELPWELAGHDGESLARAMDGCEALVNALGLVPGGRRRAPELRTATTRFLTEGARLAGVRRLVQRSTSLLYADQGDEWITEASPVCVTSATERVSMAEVVAQELSSVCRVSVVLRLGCVLGSGVRERWNPFSSPARVARPGAGEFLHVIHEDDVGAAFVEALALPSGTYNVGAEPVRRDELAAAWFRGARRGAPGPLGRARDGLARRRMEPLHRSLRVSSALLGATAGWSPRRNRFDSTWLEPSPARVVLG